MPPYSKHASILVAICALVASDCFAQPHLEPPNGGDGIPGTITSSFLFTWASVDSAVNYEYIVSNNPLCFAGCPGDTRQAITGGDTTVTEYNMLEGIWYYWITRVYYSNGDTTNWSVISSFLAKTPPEAEPDELIKIALNPTSSHITLEIDWAVNPDATKISAELFSLSGQTVSVPSTIEKSGNNRYQTHQFQSMGLAKGIYNILFIVDDNPNNPNNKFIKRIMISE